MEKKYEKIIKFYLNDTKIELGESEFLLFVSFVIRCKKEIEWIKFKGFKGTTYLFSKKISIIYLKVDGRVTIVYRYMDYELTNQEFETYVEYLYSALDDYKHIDGLNYKDLDPVYLEYMLAVDLPYLIDSYLESKCLRDLKIFVNNGNYVEIADSKHYKMIQTGTIPEVETYTNLVCQTHEERVKLLCEEFACEDYGSNGRYIVLYNDTDVIRDGAHRAAILQSHNVSEPIIVRRMIFEQNFYTFDRFFNETTNQFYFKSMLFTTCNTRWLMVKGKKSRVLRSDSLKHVDQRDIELLRENGIGTCIDLTTKTDKKNIDELRRSFAYYNVPISYLNSVLDVNYSDYYSSTDYYMFILSQKDKIKDVFNKLMNSKDGIIIYCAIGRDRTGIISILIQMLLGCDRAEIIEDYSLTDEIYKNKQIGIEKGFSRESARKYIIHFLQRFYEEYGSIEGYMMQMEFEQDDMARLREILAGEQ